jgi:hypothetical protein
MQKFLLILVAGLLVSACSNDYGYDEELRNLLSEIDHEIENCDNYDNLKQQRIDSLKSVLSHVDLPNSEARYNLNETLFHEYESYICDSALHYANCNLALARHMQSAEKYAATQLLKVGVLSRAGLFKEAIDALGDIDAAALNDDLKFHYYVAQKDIYQFLREYAAEGEYSEQYSQLTMLYGDSIAQLSNNNEFANICNKGSGLTELGRYREAEQYLTKALEQYRMGSREYAVITSILAYNYQRKGQLNDAERYLAMSALSDMRACVKENMSMRSLSGMLYRQGDIVRANNYLKKSIADATFFSARLRNNQSSQLLPIVDESYNALQMQSNSRLKWSVIAISVLTVGLIIALLVIFKQLNKISTSHRKVLDAHKQLANLNRELSGLNERLSTTNQELQESNIIKQTYIAQFMELCSTYILALEQYRKTLRKQVSVGNVADLKSRLEDTDTINNILREFYATFDRAFLKLCPKFIDQFNALLPEEERIVIKTPDKLNTELRIYALIRLGISDSGQIAQFLRCSLNTIYSYRSKIKNRSLYRDTFEAEVLKIAF